MPVHAYPCPNHLELPSRIDFGRCQVGLAYTQRLRLSCKVPMDVEFEVQLSNSQHGCYKVTPSSGCISAVGGCEVAVEYRPIRFVTNTDKLVVR